MPEPSKVASDLTQVPNFEAVDAWLSKLAAWCEDAVAALEERLDADAEERLHERVATLESLNADLEHKADHFDSFVELFFDMRRGMREPGEIEAWLKDKGFDA
jgi:hypothetical protein